MSVGIKVHPAETKTPQVNDLLMKPFSLGWTREVVYRLVTNNKTPNCDIYYFNPNKKKLRSLAEVRCNLTDGLSPECFSFKRQPLGLSPDLETVRDARSRTKKTEKSEEKKRDSLRAVKKLAESKNENKEVNDSEKEAKIDVKAEVEEDLKVDAPLEINQVKQEAGPSISADNIEDKQKSENESETVSNSAPSNVKQSDETKTVNSKKKTKTKSKQVRQTKSVRVQSAKKRKTVLKKIMNVKQAKQVKLVASRKVSKEIGRKTVPSLTSKLSKTKINNKSAIKTKKNNAVKLKGVKKPVKTRVRKNKNDAKEQETAETDKKSATRDLKSIVKKNIVKYREMREKQKLGVAKAQRRSSSSKIPAASVSRYRLEPICINKSFYLKPIEKGWRRELVFRTNCTKAGQVADVYYFHPNGKKLRSFREISENLTPGLSLECFTFRKEPIGCGEPSEVVRSARLNNRSRTR